MSKPNEILTIKEPSITRAPIILEHYGKEQANSADATKIEGSDNPVIRINTFEIMYTDLIKFKLSSVNFLPTLDIVFYDRDKIFSGDFVKDGDLVEIYIRSRNDKKFKKIRTDFDILKVSSIVDNDEVIIYSLSCVQKIPNIFKEVQFGLKEDTSFNHLIEVCDKSGLGFASNEVSTFDKMTRICANKTVGNFINDITYSAYKNDESFYTSYIDIYDYLCFVNVNECFSLSNEAEETEIDIMTAANRDKGTTEEGSKSKLFFSNHPDVAGSTGFVKKFSLFNNSGNIWMSQGYNSITRYMDMDELEFRNFLVDPLTTKGAEKDFIILKGKAGDNSYLEHSRCNFFGRMFSNLNEGSLHPNYYYAKNLNTQNNIEITKMGANITLHGFSSNIYRYKRIPLLIFDSGNILNKTNSIANNSETDNKQSEIGNENDLILNDFLSGFYVVKDFSINWDSSTGFSQSINLIRREWPIPVTSGIMKKI